MGPEILQIKIGSFYIKLPFRLIGGPKEPIRANIAFSNRIGSGSFIKFSSPITLLFNKIIIS